MTLREVEESPLDVLHLLGVYGTTLNVKMQRWFHLVQTLEVVLAPRALKDLQNIRESDAADILDDLELLRTPPWPGSPKTKRLQGKNYYRLRTGPYRSAFSRIGDRVVVARVVARKDLDRVLKPL